VSGHGAVLGGFANLKVNGVPHDVLILHSGLLLLADQQRSGSDLKRLNRLLAEVPIEELVRRHRLIRFEDVTGARVVKRTPLRVELDLVGDDRLTLVAGWTTPLLTRQSDKVLCDLLTDLPRTRPLSEQAAARAGQAWSEGATVLDAVGNVNVNGAAYDVVVLDVGLVLIADPGPFEQGQARLTRLVQGTPAYEIVGRNWLVRYEQVVDARITKTLPLQAEIALYEGRQLAIHERMVSHGLTPQSRNSLVDALRSVGG
jgi:hypothetical protein